MHYSKTIDGLNPDDFTFYMSNLDTEVKISGFKGQAFKVLVDIGLFFRTLARRLGGAFFHLEWRNDHALLRRINNEVISISKDHSTHAQFVKKKIEIDHTDFSEIISKIAHC